MIAAAMAALAITLTGTVASVESAARINDLLRQIAIEAGCPKERVRIAMRWQGQGQPLEITVRCAEHPE